MKIELVGGPDCGCVINVKYIDKELDIRGAKYVRRDRPFNLSERYGAVYGQLGYRMYDYAAYIRSGKEGVE